MGFIKSCKYRKTIYFLPPTTLLDEIDVTEFQFIVNQKLQPITYLPIPVEEINNVVQKYILDFSSKKNLFKLPKRIMESFKTATFVGRHDFRPEANEDVCVNWHRKLSLLDPTQYHRK